MIPAWVGGIGIIVVVVLITIGACLLFDYLTKSGPFDPWYREMRSRQKAQRKWRQ